MKIADRIDKAIAEHADDFGEVPYTELARHVFPPDQYPRATYYSSNGGPPGCYMALSRAITRYGFGERYDDQGTRKVSKRRNPVRAKESEDG